MRVWVAPKSSLQTSAPPSLFWSILFFLSSYFPQVFLHPNHILSSKYNFKISEWEVRGKKTDCQSTDCVFSLRNHSCKEEQQKKSLLKTTIWGKKWFYLTLAWMSFDLFVLYFLKVWSQITYIFILIDIHVTIFPCFLKQFYFLDLSIWNQKLEGLCC